MTDNGERVKRNGQSSSRQVRLTLRYVSVWSATKIAFLCGVGLGLLAGIGTVVLWNVLTQLGVFSQLSSLFSGTSAGSSAIAGTFGFSQAVGVAALLGPLNTILATLTGTLGAALYNFGVRVTGGATVGFTTDN